MSDLAHDVPRYGTAAHIFETVRDAGELELLRPAASLWWSGLAAGIAMSTSVVGRAVLEQHLPHAPAVSAFGYCFGFVIVVVGRMQLFTENTITTVLPLLRRRDLVTLVLTVRLWLVVFLANLVGAGIAAVLLVAAPLGSEDQLAAIAAVSRVGTDGPFFENFRVAIPAGFLIAALVWTIAAQSVTRLWLVVGLTWLVALGDYAHVVAGAVEMFVVLWLDGAGEIQRVWTFLLPALAGNVVGGTGLFALLAYAQVQHELAPPEALHEPVVGMTTRSE